MHSKVLGFVSKEFNSSEAIAHIWNSAIRPVITYGCQSVYIDKKSVDELDKIQSKLLKSVLGLKSYCRTTPVLNALKMNKISTTVEIDELNLLRTMLHSTSRASIFYKHVFNQYHRGENCGDKNLISRVHHTCKKYGISVIKYLCDQEYANSQKRVLQRIPTNDGVVDTVRHLITNINQHSRVLVNMLLKPF